MTQQSSESLEMAARDPLGFLHGAFDQEMHRLESRRAELAAAREALLALEGADRRPDSASDRPVWERVPPEMTPAVVERLTAITDDIQRACTMTVELGPGVDGTNIREGQRRIAGGLVQRAIYPLHLLDSPVGQRWIRSWNDVGEDQRFVDQTPTEFAVFGSHAVVAVEEWGDPGGPYVLIRDPMLIAVFTAYFDAAFSAGLPMPTERATDEEDRRLLRLLAMAIKDEAIARHLGWSLRTVRRRVARLMGELGVETRFQLGIAAERAGLIREERSH